LANESIKATARNTIIAQKKLPVNKKTRIARSVAGKNSISIFKKKAITNIITTNTKIPIHIGNAKGIAWNMEKT